MLVGNETTLRITFSYIFFILPFSQKKCMRRFGVKGTREWLVSCDSQFREDEFHSIIFLRWIHLNWRRSRQLAETVSLLLILLFSCFVLPLMTDAIKSFRGKKREEKNLEMAKTTCYSARTFWLHRVYKLWYM